MRALVLLTLLAACRSNDAKPAFFESDKASSAECAAVEPLNARGSLVTDVTTAPDDNLLVLYGADREVVVYDSSFNVVTRLSFDRAGPRGVREPVSASTDGDLFYLLDERQLAVKILDAQGNDRGIIRLDFVPRRIRAVGGTILVTPVVAASHPPSLLYEVREGKVESRGIPPAHYEDGALNLLANMSSLAVFDDGRAVVMHEMIVPFGYSVSPAGAASLPKQFAVPLPTAVRSRIHKLPATPLTTKSMDEILTVALTAAADPHTGHLYYLTRSGMRTGGGWEKVIVELDHDLSFVRAARLGRFLPQHMTFVPVRKSLLLTDDEGTWLECKL